MSVRPVRAGEAFQSDMSADSQPLIGVLALQGAFAAHEDVLHRLNCRTRRVRTMQDIANLDGLILPGGESTTMSQLLLSSGLFHVVSSAIQTGLPVFGTCAGMILLASRISDGRDDQVCFSAIDIEVRRNAYGRQIDSFERDLTVQGCDHPVPALFIRAPIVETIGPGVEILARDGGRPCLVRQGRVWASAFHPELTSDETVHSLFIDSVQSCRNVEARDMVERRSPIGTTQEQE